MLFEISTASVFFIERDLLLSAIGLSHKVVHAIFPENSYFYVNFKKILFLLLKKKINK